MKKLLIVDDDPKLLALLEKFFKKEFLVCTAKDGNECLEILKNSKFDAVILDVVMPGLSGLETLHHIKLNYPEIEVIILTGDPTEEKLVKALKNQAFSFVTKPVQLSELYTHVKNAIRRKREEDIHVISAKPDFIEVVIPTHREYVSRLKSFMVNLNTGLPKEKMELIGFAFSEMLENAIEHGNKNDLNKKISIAFTKFSKFILYRIRDNGDGFDFTNMAHSVKSLEFTDIISTLEQRESQGMRPGGMGIFTTKCIMDEVLYNEKCNEVVLVKYIEK